jgi:hypothetical protein
VSTGKTCAKCKEAKPLSEFGPDRSTKDGRHPYCRACRREAARLYREKNPGAAGEAARRYRERHPERQREAERRWRAAHPEYRQQYNPERLRRRREANRNAVLDRYGRSCACCGATDRLGIDHIHGDGKRHRAEIGVRTGTQTHEWLVSNGFPDGFQTLCGPCNTSKGRGARCRLDHGPASAA